MGILKKHPTLFLGISITILFLAMAFMRAGFLDTMDLKLYDVGMSLRGDPDSASNMSWLTLTMTPSRSWAVGPGPGL